jgi:CBS domain-containing protein
MPVLVRDWMKSPVIVIDPDSSVSYAMTLMRRRNIHSLVVDLTAQGGEYGIVTTTDFSNKIVATDRNPAETTVREIMTAPVITGKAEWTLKEASALMQKYHFHHLPIVDEHSILVGIISDTDIFMAVEEIGWKK